MIETIKKRMKSDRGDSVITAIIVMPLIFFMLITSIDVSLMLSHKGTIENMARDSARTVAIVGGDGTSNRATPLEKAYGVPRDDCSDYTTKTISGSPSANFSNIECALSVSLNEANMVNVEIQRIGCTPDIALGVGAKTECTVRWKHGGIPGSTMGFIQLGNDMEAIGSSESEVDLTGISTVQR